MQANNFNVSGLYLRGVLAGLRRITGQQYSGLLEQSGLGQFSQKYPAATLQTVATGKQLITLMGLVRELVGPVVFNLFFTNLGRNFGHVMATLPQLQAKSVELAASPDRIVRLVETIGELHYLALGGKVETIMGATRTSLVIVYHDCIYCTAYSQAQAPVCVNIPGLYKQLLFELTGKRCQVEETKCAAMVGGKDCFFLLTYPDY